MNFMCLYRSIYWFKLRILLIFWFFDNVCLVCLCELCRLIFVLCFLVFWWFIFVSICVYVILFCLICNVVKFCRFVIWCVIELESWLVNCNVCMWLFLLFRWVFSDWSSFFLVVIFLSDRLVFFKLFLSVWSYCVF